MKAKKHPKADLGRNKGLYFAMGLAFSLFLTWRALELKTYDRVYVSPEFVEVIDAPIEDIPITETVITEPPPPPPVAPQVIEIVEDMVDIEETKIESTETGQDEVIEQPVVKVEDVKVVAEEEDVVVPFAVIENVPVFPGCKGNTNEEQKECFQRKIQEHIKKHFTYPEDAVELGIQGKVYVQFMIDAKGYTTDIKTRGPNIRLEKEAARIISSLPQMTPGMQRGRAVRVTYSIPISFKLE